LWFLVGFVLAAIPLTSLYTASNDKYLLSAYASEDGVRTIYIYGWTVEDGGWNPGEIIIRSGERVRLVIRSMDMSHGFQIPELGIDAGVIKPGYETVIEVSFERPGEYTFYCSVYSSPLHYKMIGKIVVVQG